ncbi:glycosyltransferase N-terminal domain-containing protein [Acidihalobacter ferrooxydans]|uniref:3-deoxy-D-manno-octulosonic acid transferase n=1 Tax=Acidihalobacter ferrooxydans TaxID=1765967 RepID=A0A1P8UFN2_9GAMM|nr:glycosyltransferase N-terminal domain-containing protein [Acidihalobacter ferrooxydans]APZ42655.1 hypothetical protein BW247_05705 [Acidihalobacter ferrooxydans]
MGRDPQGYGSGWWAALSADRRDRRAGAAARANARRGYLLAPKGEGKVIWFKAGGTAESVLLACELLGALREKRLDVRLALTFERDDADIIEPRVRGLRKIGLGYGPGDRPAAVARVMERLSPFGLILVDTAPRPNLLKAASAAGTHVVAFNTAPGAVAVEAAYPVDAAQASAWIDAGLADAVAEPVDPLALFVEAQADTTLHSLVAAGQDDLKLWWWHGPDTERADFVRRWRASTLAADSVLFVSGDAFNVAVADLRISAWDRSALPPGRVVALDDSRWTAAVASAVDAGYLGTPQRRVYWQALAGNSAFCVAPTHPLADAPLPVAADADAVLRDWSMLREAPAAARQRGDAGRRRFWDERRHAKQVMDEFLQRAFDW